MFAVNWKLKRHESDLQIGKEHVSLILRVRHKDKIYRVKMSITFKNISAILKSII